MVNELRNIVTDGGALLILVIAVLIYPTIYSIAYKNNVLEEIPVALVDLDRTAESRALGRMVDGSPKLKIASNTGSFAEAEALFWEGKVKGIVLIKNGFSSDIFKGNPSAVSVYCDAGYFLMYKETLTGVLKASGTFAAGVEIKRLMVKGMRTEQAFVATQPVQPEMRMLYNPSGAYGSYVMPGIILLIIQQTLLVGIGYVGGARHESGNVDGRHPGLSHLGNVVSVISGRTFAYLILYTFNLAFTLICVHTWFGYNDKAMLMHVFTLVIPFLLSAIFMAMTISPMFRRREHSIIFMVFLSPILFFLSGVSWPATSIPTVLNRIAYLIPSTHVIPGYLRLRTMGAEINDVIPELLRLWALAAFYFLTACVSTAIMWQKHRGEPLSIQTP